VECYLESFVHVHLHICINQGHLHPRLLFLTSTPNIVLVGNKTAMFEVKCFLRRGRALTETLRVNTTVMSLKLGFNGLGEGGGRALAETLRFNTTVTSLNLSDNGMGEEVRSELDQA
jgi:hypothetical protein